MIFLFPDLDTIQLLLTTGIIPREICTSPAQVSTDEAGRISIEMDARLSRKQKEALERLGVSASKRHTGPVSTVSNWLTLFPLVPGPGATVLTSQLPVLFELVDTTLLSSLVAEMIRLGNDRQSYCLLEGASPENSRILLRVVGPPYYTLLRAVDRPPGESTKIRAYVEQAPSVWVEWGYSHPFVKQIKPDATQILLLSAPKEWQFLPLTPFEDVYQLLDFQLPSSPQDWAASPLPEKCSVPLRLVAGNAADQPELWVIRGEHLTQIDRLVRDADDRLLEQLTFAIATNAAGEKTCVLRVRPTKRQPPILALDRAVGFKPYWRIPNLYLPAGLRLQPVLRRDTITQLLAEDSDQLVWLYPGDNGNFTPERLPQDSFRSLSDWVEYIIDTHHVELSEWVEATTFDFDSFICAETQSPRPKVPGEKLNKEKKSSKEPVLEPKEREGTPLPGVPKETEPSEPTAALPSSIVVKPPSEWKIRCEELERAFLAQVGPLESETRQALWPELALANTGMVSLGEERRTEAAICWLNAIWADGSKSKDWFNAWCQTELGSDPKTLTAERFEQLMHFGTTSHTPAQCRMVLAAFLSAASRTSIPTWLPSRLASLQNYLEAHEEKLPIRGVWLAFVRIAQLSKSDVLGLARVRDRLLNRLLESGLNPEQDLPGFLRFSGSHDSHRLRLVREKSLELHRVARKWVQESLLASSGVASRSDTRYTPAFVDLMFAYGFATLGEASEARHLIEQARAVLEHPQEMTTAGMANTYLFRVFQFRIETILEGKQNAQEIPQALIEQLEAIEARIKSEPANGPSHLVPYIIARMAEQSQIFEPHEKVVAKTRAMVPDDAFKKELVDLRKEKDPGRIPKRIRDLLKLNAKSKTPAPQLLEILHTSLSIANRFPMDLAIELIGLLPKVLVTPPAPPAHSPAEKTSEIELLRMQGQVLERAIFLAAHYDKHDLVQSLVDQLINHVRNKSDEQRFELVSIVAGQCLKSLRKVGLRDDIDKMLHRMQTEVLKGKSLAELKQKYSNQPDPWSDVLQCMLGLAAGWLTFGLADQAAEAIDAARAEIFLPETKRNPRKFVRLCQSYVTTIGQCPVETGMERLLELFQHLRPARIQNTFTTAPYFSVYHLMFIESVVLALVSDNFALGQSGRRWLEEDEFLIRKRIHQDMRKVVLSSDV